MSTSAAIGIKLPDGSVKAIRLNWDGYVAHAGAILGGWYKTAEAVNDLIALGDLSEINETVESCVAYHRDRGEQYRLPRTFASVEDYQYCGMGQMNANSTSTSSMTEHGTSMDSTEHPNGSDWK